MFSRILEDFERKVPGTEPTHRGKVWKNSNSPSTVQVPHWRQVWKNSKSSSTGSTHGKFEKLKFPQYRTTGPSMGEKFEKNSKSSSTGPHRGKVWKTQNPPVFICPGDLGSGKILRAKFWRCSQGFWKILNPKYPGTEPTHKGKVWKNSNSPSTVRGKKNVPYLILLVFHEFSSLISREMELRPSKWHIWVAQKQLIFVPNNIDKLFLVVITR